MLSVLICVDIQLWSAFLLPLQFLFFRAITSSEGCENCTVYRLLSSILLLSMIASPVSYCLLLIVLASSSCLSSAISVSPSIRQRAWWHQRPFVQPINFVSVSACGYECVINHLKFISHWYVMHYVFWLSVCPSVYCPPVRPLTPISCDTISLYLVWRDFSETCRKYSSRDWMLLERFSRSEVKGQKSKVKVCTNAAFTFAICRPSVCRLSL